MGYGVALLVALLSAAIWRSRYPLKNSILFKSEFPVGYFDGGNFHTQCTVVKQDDLKFCEDLTFWELHNADKVERRVIASCDPGRHEWNTVMGPLNDPDPHGALWIYAPGNSKAVRPQRIRFEDYPEGHDFHPLGLDVYPSFDGNASNMFVVNHARQRSYIEQFVISPSEPVARHVRTVSPSYLVAPNALTLTSPNSFYVTNDRLFTRRLPLIGPVVPLFDILGAPFGWVRHVTLTSDIKSVGSPILTEYFAATLIPFANGISLSPSGKEVAVASCSFSHILFYDRDPISNELKYREQVPVPFTPDNIMFIDDETLIVAGHPNFPDLIKLAAKKNPVAGSWILSVHRRDESNVPAQWDTLAPVSASSKIPAVTNYAVETIFQSNGTGFSSSTTGLLDPSTGVFYGTGLYQDGLLVCKPQKK